MSCCQSSLIKYNKSWTVLKLTAGVKPFYNKHSKLSSRLLGYRLSTGNGLPAVEGYQLMTRQTNESRNSLIGSLSL